jgi:hypothetical protein
MKMLFDVEDLLNRRQEKVGVMREVERGDAMVSWNFSVTD